MTTGDLVRTIKAEDLKPWLHPSFDNRQWGVEGRITRVEMSSVSSVPALYHVRHGNGTVGFYRREELMHVPNSINQNLISHLAANVKIALDQCHRSGLQGGVFDGRFYLWPIGIVPQESGVYFFDKLEQVGVCIETNMALDGGAGI